MMPAFPNYCPKCGAYLNSHIIGVGEDYDDRGNKSAFLYCACGYEFREKEPT